MAASVDHAVWLHRPVRATDWLLFELHGHGVANAHAFSEDWLRAPRYGMSMGIGDETNPGIPKPSDAKTWRLR